MLPGFFASLAVRRIETDRNAVSIVICAERGKCDEFAVRRVSTTSNYFLEIWVKPMAWEYQVVTAETSDTFQVALNAAGAEGWEAIFGGYTLGEPTKVSLGQGMPLSTRPGAPIWSAIMKRST